MVPESSASDDKFCISCGQGMRTDAEICPECGTEQDASKLKFCISCKEMIPTDTELCPECGVRQDASSLSSDTKHCADCGEEIKVNAEICPECGIRQQSGTQPSDTTAATSSSGGTVSSGSTDQGKPSAGEAVNLMLVYYQNHPVRAFIHALIALFTAGTWLAWFVFFWFGTFVGWKDVEGMRQLRDSR